MNYKEQIAVLEKEHELKMVELAYQRDTELVKIEYKWKLYNPVFPTEYPQQQQPLPPLPLPAQPPSIQQPAAEELEKSKEKYGRK